MSATSVLSLVGSMLVAVGDTARLLHDIQSAPPTILELKNQLISLGSILQLLLDRPSQNEAIAKELCQAQETMRELELVLRQDAEIDPQKKNISMRMKWVLKVEKRATKLRKKLNAHVSILGILLNVEARQRLRQSDGTVNAPNIIIAVMGETGAGKSTFIQRITQSMHVGIGNSLKSETQTVQAYSVMVEGQVITLVDTPGFDDTSRTDVEVLEELSSWLTVSYQSRQLVSGIIYLHPITSNRMRGSSQKNLDVFASLVGPDSFHNILLVTTMWDLLPEISLGESRENELREDFWKDLIEKGSITARSSGDRQSALAIMKRIAFDHRIGSASGGVRLKWLQLA